MSLGLLAGCGAAAARVPAAAPGPALVTDTVWFLSARGREDGRDARVVSDSLTFGLAFFSGPARVAGADGKPAPADPELVLVDSLFLSPAAFAEALRARVRALAAPSDFAVLYVHGYGTGLQEGWGHAATARRRARTDAPWVVFSWPSNGAGVDWPSLDALVERAYLDDSAAAQASIPAFDGALRAIVDAVGSAQTVLVTHSLGVQLAGEALAARPALRQRFGGDPLRAIAFVAPDMEARRFGDYVVPAALPLARRVVLYASARDRVLALSRQLHGSERAGLVRGTPLTRAGLETVETTLGERAIGRVRRLVDTHHAIARASATLFDLAHVVGTEQAPGCRATLGLATHAGGTLWRLTSQALPLRVDLTPCTAPASR